MLKVAMLAFLLAVAAAFVVSAREPGKSDEQGELKMKLAAQKALIPQRVEWKQTNGAPARPPAIRHQPKIGHST